MESQFQDREITCVECGTTFIFTAGQQRFWLEKGLENDPKRCAPCKEAKKQAMARRALPREQREPVESIIICAECGREDTVPFIPRGGNIGNPVYCRKCFFKKKAEPNEANFNR